MIKALSNKERQMTLIERFKEECKLPESIGLVWRDGFLCLAYYCGAEMEDVVDFGDDDCIASALFIVRSLKALAPLNPVLELDDAGAHCWGASFTATGTTMAQAVGEALIAAFPGESQS